MITWKLFRDTRNGPRSLFIDRTRVIPENEWLDCVRKPTKGYAVREGWHTLEKPVAPHLSENGRVWRRVEIDGLIAELSRPETQGGKWFTSRRLRLLPEVA